MMVADDKDSDRVGFYSIKKMIGKSLQIGPSQIVEKKTVPDFSEYDQDM
jgi:hypothetical protein